MMFADKDQKGYMEFEDFENFFNSVLQITI